MRNLTFKYAGAWNFLPFGPAGIELHFDRFKNVVLVRGENRDARAVDPGTGADEFRVSSNGSGKSSLAEIVVYALYGRTVKRPEKLGVNDVVHNKVGRDCRVELRWNDYRLVRTRKEGGKDTKNNLRLWRSPDGVWDESTEETQGTMAATQKAVEAAVGLSYDAFLSVCVFTDDQRSSFLECDGVKKKEIVENMLSLGAYREWFDRAKALRKEVKAGIDSKVREFQLLLGGRDDAERRRGVTAGKEAAWRLSKGDEVKKLADRLAAAESSLSSTDEGAALLAYEDAQRRIASGRAKLEELRAVREDTLRKSELARAKRDELRSEAQVLTARYEELSLATKRRVADRQKLEGEIASAEANVPGARCGKCRGEVRAENIAEYVKELRGEVSALNVAIGADLASAREVAAATEALKARQEKVSEVCKALDSKASAVARDERAHQDDVVAASAVREPKAGSAQQLLQQQVETLRDALAARAAELTGRSPFADILENDLADVEKAGRSAAEKEAEVKVLEADLPYYDFWVAGFGEAGIRKWVVDGVVPELNNRIAYWLQFLIDNRISLRFDDELRERIERNPPDGDPYIYHAMSTGQRRRLNLAVSQAFSHVMALSAGAAPSLVFLDEVSTNVDPSGVLGIYRMIEELAEDRQVFVTTHDPDLVRMLGGCDTIDLRHEDGFTTLV